MLCGFGSIKSPGGGSIATPGKRSGPYVPIVDDRGMYVWGNINDESTAPGIPEVFGANGHYLSMHAANHMMLFASDNGYDRVVVTNNFFANAPNTPGWIENTQNMIALAHDTYGLLIEGLTTTGNRVDEMATIGYDAIRLDLETFPAGASEDTTQPLDPEDMDAYKAIKAAAGHVPIYAFIGWHWNEEVTWQGATKPAYEHILDIMSGVDISPGWGRDLDNGGDTAIITRTTPVVQYAHSKKKPAWITLTSKPHATDPNQTFYDEGETAMHAVGNVLLNQEGIYEPNGILYHFWLSSLGADEELWPSASNFSAAWPDEVDLTFRISPDESIKKNIYGTLLDFSHDGTALEPVFYYEAKWATSTVWQDNSEAECADLIPGGTGTAFDVDQPAPIHDRTAVKFNMGKVFETDGDYGDMIGVRDTAVEWIAKIGDTSSATQRAFFGKYDGATHHFFCYQASASVVCQVGDVGLIKCMDGNAVTGAWVHFLWLLDRDYQSQCYANGIAGGGVIGIGAAANTTNANTFVIGGLTAALQPSDATIEHVAMWQCPQEDQPCLDTATTDIDENGIYDWRDIAKTRLLKFNHLWPSTDSIGVWHETNHRQSPATVSMQASDGGARNMFTVFNGWPRLEEMYLSSTPYYAYVSEPDGINYALHSNDFGNEAWTKAENVSVTSNVVSTTATSSISISQTVTGLSNKSSAHSVLIKPSNVDWVLVTSTDGTTESCYFDLVNKTKGTCTADGDGYVEDYGHGWVRVCMIDGSAGTAGTAYTTTYTAAEADEDTEFASTPGEAYTLSSGQFENWIERCTSYMPTTTASASRAFDVSLYTSTTAFFDSDGSVYSKYIGPDVDNFTYKDSNDSRQMYRFDNGSTSSLYLAQSAGESVQGVCSNAGSAQFNVSGSTLVNTGVQTKHRQKFSDDDYRLLIDGNSEGTDASVSFPETLTNLYLGGRESEGDQINGYVTDLQVYSTSTNEAH